MKIIRENPLAKGSGGYGTHSLVEKFNDLNMGWVANIIYPPMPTLNVIPNDVLAFIRGELFKSGSIVLNLGAGNSTGCGIRLWEGGGGVGDFSLFNLDIGLGDDVNVVGDAHRLPLVSDSVDAVVMQAVLEHLASPELAIEEVFRILKPGGVLYIEMPFLQGFHADPHDYQRYTVEGLRQLLSSYDEIASGVSVGPFCSLVWLLRDGLSSCFTNKWLYALSRFIWGWLFSPLRYLDYLVRGNRAAYRLANEYYYLCRKPL